MATLTKKELQEKCRVQQQELAKVRVDLRNSQMERSKDKQLIADLTAKLNAKPEPKVQVVRTRRVEDEAELAELRAKVDILQRELSAK